MLAIMNTPHDRLAQARRAAGYPTATDAARAFGFNETTYRAHEAGQRGVRQDAAERYGRAFKVAPAWITFGEGDPPEKSDVVEMAARRSNARDPRPVLPDYSGETLPVFGSAMGGPDGRMELNGQVIDRIAAPPGLRGTTNAYAVYVTGESMEPRYFEGETLYIHPGKPVRSGDFVLLQLKPKVDGDPYEGLVKRLVSRGAAKVTVEQYNPPMQIEFNVDEVRAIHRIVLGGE